MVSKKLILIFGVTIIISTYLMGSVEINFIGKIKLIFFVLSFYAFGRVMGLIFKEIQIME